MVIKGICSICGRAETMHTCHLCGRNVCSNCYDIENGICVACKRGKI